MIGVQLAPRFRRLPVICSPQAHLTHVSSLSGRAPARIRPVMREPAGGGSRSCGPGFLLPFGHRHSLLGSSCARWGIEPSSRSAYRPRSLAGPQRGCHVAHEQAATGQGASFTPGTVVRSRPATILRPAPAALLRPVPTAPLEHPIGGGHFHETSSRGSLAFTHHPGATGSRPEAGKAIQPPAGLLLARGPRMEQRPLRLLPRASHPAVTRDARQGGDRPSRTGPGTTPPASAGPPTAPPT